jgi:hypothetical protein
MTLKRRRLIILTCCETAISGDAPRVISDKDIYNNGESIRVSFFNAPGSSNDWICIVPAGTPDTDSGDYKYVPNGLSQGSLIFDRRSPGKYEVRAYYNYRHKTYLVSARYPFSVEKSTEGEAVMAREVDPQNPIEANLPPENGLVYIFREPLSWSSSSEVQIKANEKPSVFIINSSYFPFPIAAGDVKFTRGETNTMVQITPGRECEATINVKPGYVYYLRLQVIHNPFLLLILDQVPHQEGANFIKNNKLNLLKR